jgi:hypothetical protein
MGKRVVHAIKFVHPVAPAIADHQSRWNSLTSEHQHHCRGVHFAVPGVMVSYEIFHGIQLVVARDIGVIQGVLVNGGIQEV